MFCKYCGTELPDGSTTCTNCGRVINKGAAASQKLREQAEKFREQGRSVETFKVSKTTKEAFLILGLAIATVFCGFILVSLRIGAGSQTQGLAAILVSIMTLTGNRKLVPYISVLEPLVIAFSMLAAFAAVISGAGRIIMGGVFVTFFCYVLELAIDVLYVMALFKGAKEQPCAWRYLPPAALLGVYGIIFFVNIGGAGLIKAILVLIGNLPYAAYRFLMIHWMFDAERE